MATLYKKTSPSRPKNNNTSWYIIEYYTDHVTDESGNTKSQKKKRYLERLGYMTRTKAKLQLDKYNARNKNKKNGQVRLTLNDAATEFDKHYQNLIGPNITQGTYGLFKYHLERITPVIGHIQLSKLEFENIEALKISLLGKGLSNRSVNMHITELKKILEYSIDRGWIQDYPKIKRLSEAKPDREIEYLTNEEIETLLAKANPAQALYLCLMIFSGMRPNESAKLTWDCVNLEQGYIDVISMNRLKAGRRIPLHSKIKEMLLNSPKDSAYVSPYRTSAYAKKAMERLENITGIKCNPYKLRKTFGSILAQAGVNTMGLATLMGHSKLQTTYQFYARLSDNNLKNDIEKLVLLGK
ncbi:MAG: site-specific integrase [Candidatus Margulisiibacteriota bacterium]|jgi:integrase/recombinase XerD